MMNKFLILPQCLSGVDFGYQKSIQLGGGKMKKMMIQADKFIKKLEELNISFDAGTFYIYLADVLLKYDSEDIITALKEKTGLSNKKINKYMIELIEKDAIVCHKNGYKLTLGIPMWTPEIHMCDGKSLWE